MPEDLSPGDAGPWPAPPTQDTAARSAALPSEHAEHLASCVCGDLLSHFGEGQTFVLRVRNPMTSQEKKCGVEEGDDVEVKVGNADVARVSSCESAGSRDGFVFPRPLA